MECTTNCMSKQHGKYLTSAFTIEDINTLKEIVKNKCSNPLRNSDQYGRSIFHVCASMGFYDFLSWLCNEWKTVNILQTKDKESGWTSLHRAIYYGHIDCAVLIHNVIQDWNAVDTEGQSSLDLLVSDSPRVKKYKTKKQSLAVVVLPFQSGEPGELTLNTGDTLEILSTNKNGWGVGRLQESGAKGLFPITFVEEIKEIVKAEQCRRFVPIQSVFMWGNNVNYVLGVGDSKNRANPELLDGFWTEQYSIKDCVVTKFHSIYLTECGNVFSCGHGLSGRLGHGREETVLQPKMIEYFKDINCVAVDAAYSHTIILDEFGRAYTFGFNDFHQLGHAPPPSSSSCLSPKQINWKPLKNKTLIGVAAGRFHSVIYTDHEVYTFGLNAGQLGHPKGDKLQTSPKLVSNLYKKEVSIGSVAASDGATVCFLKNGELYLFQDYLCRKIVTRLLDVCEISVTGGMLQCNDLESFNKPEPLQIAILHTTGVVNMWRSGFNSLKICYWLGQKISNSKIVHISLGKHMTVVTDSGQAYFGYFLNKAVANTSNAINNQVKLVQQKVEVQSVNFTLNEIIERNKKVRNESVEVNLVKIPLIYRCVKCFTDSKSRTFAAIQSDARVGLTKYPIVSSSTFDSDMKAILLSANVDDDIHDSIIETKEGKIPIHKFILASRLNNFDTLLGTSEISSNESNILKISCDSYKPIMAWLHDVYTGKDTTQVPQPHRREKTSDTPDIDDTYFAKQMTSLALADIDDNILSLPKREKKKERKKRSAYSVYKENINSCETPPQSLINSHTTRDIISLNSLTKWRSLERFSDITIESEEGCLFHCHKCVLVGRAEYFNNMLSNSWIESTVNKSGTIRIPCPGSILEVVLNYLYTDEADALIDCQDTTFIGEVLVFADQLLLDRLKKICELQLALKINIKNVIEIFEFSFDYNIYQLRKFACQFLSYNLPYYLESGLLSNLSKHCLKLLSEEYRDMVEGMGSRKMKPSIEHRKTDEVDKLFHETVANDINKIKSRRGRLSSSASKSQSSMSELDSSFHMEQPLSIHDLPNDVFEKSFLAPTMEEQHSPTIKENVNHTSPEKVLRVKTASDSALSTPNGFHQAKSSVSNKSALNKIGASNNVWGLESKRIHSSHSLSEEPSNNKAELTPKKSPGAKPFKKKSQKDRKKERTHSLSTENATDDSPPEKIEEVDEKPPKCPWGNSPSQPQAKSFREVLSEEKPVLAQTTRRKADALPLVGRDKSKKGNPWGPPVSPVNPQKPTDEANGFMSIVHVQQEEKKQLCEQAKKPLSLIQIEDRAIEELTCFYQMRSNYGEHVTVKRVQHTAMAAPFWDVVMNEVNN